MSAVATPIGQNVYRSSPSTGSNYLVDNRAAEVLPCSSGAKVGVWFLENLGSR